MSEWAHTATADAVRVVSELVESDAPIRLCCGQRHHGPVCPDGLVMCCICFNRVAVDRLHVLEEGDGSTLDSAPIHEDVCVTCKKREARWSQRASRPGQTGGAA